MAKKKKKEEWIEERSVEVVEVSKTAKLREGFKSKVFPRNRTWNKSDELYGPVGKTDPEQDFTPVFLSHARLYVLGNKYGIDNLVCLALHKLHETLTLFRLFENRASDVIELVRYAYDNTQQSSDDALRALVVEYIGAEIDVIGRSPEFRELLEEGGEFVVDFWKTVQLHLLQL